MGGRVQWFVRAQTLEPDCLGLKPASTTTKCGAPGKLPAFPMSVLICKTLSFLGVRPGHSRSVGEGEYPVLSQWGWAPQRLLQELNTVVLSMCISAPIAAHKPSPKLAIENNSLLSADDFAIWTGPRMDGLPLFCMVSGGCSVVWESQRWLRPHFWHLSWKGRNGSQLRLSVFTASHPPE